MASLLNCVGLQTTVRKRGSDTFGEPTSVSLREQCQHLFERARHADDVPAVKLHQGLVPVLVGIVDDADVLRSHGVSYAIEPVIRMNPPAILSPEQPWLATA